MVLAAAATESQQLPPRGDGPGAATWAEQLVVVLRRYREVMRAALDAADYRPIPPAANWLLLALARQPDTVTDLARRMGKEVDAKVLGRLNEREREAFGQTLGLLASPSGDTEH